MFNSMQAIELIQFNSILFYHIKKRACLRIISGLTVLYHHGLGYLYFLYLTTLFLFNSIQINSFLINLVLSYLICFKTLSIFELFQVYLSFSTDYGPIQFNLIQFKSIQLFALQPHLFYFICFKTLSIFEIFQV